MKYIYILMAFIGNMENERKSEREKNTKRKKGKNRWRDGEKKKERGREN